MPIKIEVEEVDSANLTLGIEEWEDIHDREDAPRTERYSDPEYVEFPWAAMWRGAA